MRRFILATLCLSLLLTAGCGGYFAPVMPPSGLAFTAIKAPIDTDADKTPVASKSGESSSFSIFLLFAFGDASVNSAAENGGLTTIDQVDYSYLNILGLFQSFTTIVHGE